ADDLCKLIIDELLEAQGPERTREIMRGVSRRLAAEFRTQLGNGAAAEKLARFAAMMNQRGVLVDAQAAGDGQRLTVFTCPFPELVREHPSICEMERQAIGAMVGGHAELEQCMAVGHARCAFHVTESTGRDGGHHSEVLATHGKED